MIYSEELLAALAELPAGPWHGEVFRHMFNTIPPGRENTVGARWNPAEVAAIYTSLKRQVARAEGDYYVEMQPLRPKAERRIHRIRVNLASVVDLRDWSLLEHLAISKEIFAEPEPPPCKQVGGGVAHLGHDGLLVPSARGDGANLVIFPDNKGKLYEFTPIDFSVVG